MREDFFGSSVAPMRQARCSIQNVLNVVVRVDYNSELCDDGSVAACSLGLHEGSVSDG